MTGILRVLSWRYPKAHTHPKSESILLTRVFKKVSTRGRIFASPLVGTHDEQTASLYVCVREDREESD